MSPKIKETNSDSMSVCVLMINDKGLMLSNGQNLMWIWRLIA